MAGRTYYARGPRSTGYKGTGKYTTGRKLKRAMKKKKRPYLKNVVSTGLGFPKRMIMTHRYAETGTLTTLTAGALASYQYRCNSLFDPNQTGGGHQPMYFDQMAALYDHYTVIGSKVTITWAQLPDGTGLRPPVTVGVYINDDTTVTPGINGMLENSQVTHRTMTQNTGVTATTVRKWSAKKTFGGSVLGNTDLQGDASNNPLEQQYFNLFVDSAASLTACTVMYKIVIEYIAVWNELRDLVSS